MIKIVFCVAEWMNNDDLAGFSNPPKRETRVQTNLQIWKLIRKKKPRFIITREERNKAVKLIIIPSAAFRFRFGFLEKGFCFYFCSTCPMAVPNGSPKVEHIRWHLIGALTKMDLFFMALFTLSTFGIEGKFFHPKPASLQKKSDYTFEFDSNY